MSNEMKFRVIGQLNSTLGLDKNPAVDNSVSKPEGVAKVDPNDPTKMKIDAFRNLYAAKYKGR